MSTNLNTIITHADAALRGAYSRDVLAGRQQWSGADLKGRARQYGGSYARQRDAAARALAAAGGLVLAVDHGRRVTACPIGQDDYGNAIYATLEGVAVQHTRQRARLVRHGEE